MKLFLLSTILTILLAGSHVSAQEVIKNKGVLKDVSKYYSEEVRKHRIEDFIKQEGPARTTLVVIPDLLFKPGERKVISQDCPAVNGVPSHALGFRLSPYSWPMRIDVTGRDSGWAASIQNLYGSTNPPRPVGKVSITIWCKFESGAPNVDISLFGPIKYGIKPGETITNSMFCKRGYHFAAMDMSTSGFPNTTYVHEVPYNGPGTIQWDVTILNSHGKERPDGNFTLTGVCFKITS